MFTLGSASVFGLIGALSLNRELLERLGGVVTIIMGLTFVGLVPMLSVRRSVRTFGLGLPFIVLAYGSTTATRAFGWLRRHTRTVQLVGGVVFSYVVAIIGNCRNKGLFAQPPRAFLVTEQHASREYRRFSAESVILQLETIVQVVDQWARPVGAGAGDRGSTETDAVTLRRGGRRRWRGRRQRSGWRQRG
jgi:cytochrome c-type biogenesis protein